MQRWMRAALGAVGVHSLMADGAQNQTHDIERWKKAVIHLECATDSLSPEQRARYMNQLREQFEKGEIDRDEFIERSGLGSREYTGVGDRHLSCSFRRQVSRNRAARAMG